MRLCITFSNGKLSIINLQNMNFKMKHFLESKLQLCYQVINPILKIDQQNIIIGLGGKFFRIFCLKNGKFSSPVECCKENFEDLCFFLSSGQLIFVISKNSIYIWKKNILQKWKLIYKIFCKNTINLVSKIPKSNLLLTSCRKTSKIDVWDVFCDSLFFCGKIEVQEKILHIEGSVHSRCFLVQTQKHIHVFTDNGFNSGSSFKLDFYHSHSKFFQSLIKFYDKNTILTSNSSKNLSLWDLRINKIVTEWKGHVVAVKKIDTIETKNYLDAYSFASCDTSNTVKIWDIRKNCELHSFKFYSNFFDSFKLI